MLFGLDFGITAYFLRYVSDDFEGNPLFHIDGGFIAVMVNIIFVLIVFLLEKFVVRKYETIVIKTNSCSSYFKSLFKTERFDFIIASGIYAFIMSTFASRLSAIVDWLVYGIYRGNYHTTKYAIIRDKMPFHRYDVTISVVAFIFFFLFWFRLEYKKSKQVNNSID